MTWGELKQRVETDGVKDSDEVAYMEICGNETDYWFSKYEHQEKTYFGIKQRGRKSK